MKQQQRLRPIPGTPQRITKAATYIRLLEVNPGKLAALDQLALTYCSLCQREAERYRKAQAQQEYLRRTVTA